jgi:hypothetical protein
MTTINDVLGGILRGAMKGIVLGHVLDQGYRRPPSSNWGGGGMIPGPMYPPSGHFPGSPDGSFQRRRFSYRRFVLGFLSARRSHGKQFNKAVVGVDSSAASGRGNLRATA